MPGAQEIMAYLLNHEDELTEWESNFVSNMTYWLKMRNKEPNHPQLMMLNMIFNRLKNPY